MTKEKVVMEIEDYKTLLVKEKLPRHVAIIMDGNGRWAKSRLLPRLAGHRAGIDTVRKIVKTAGEAGIKHLTLYAFSAENWRRPKKEVSGLMRLLRTFLRREIKELNRQKVCLSWIGKIGEFPQFVIDELHKCREITKDNDGLELILALNYGSRQEITEAVRQLAKAVIQGELQPEEITETVVSEYLYTANIPDPDLIIRSSGEFRLSNFLLWQAAYSELLITDTLWPDFSERDFYAALYEFQNRSRRYGGTVSSHGSARELD